MASGGVVLGWFKIIPPSHLSPLFSSISKLLFSFLPFLCVCLCWWSGVGVFLSIFIPLEKLTPNFQRSKDCVPRGYTGCLLLL